MLRSSLFFVVGGCLLGWKPEGAADTGATEPDTDPDADADTDTDTDTDCGLTAGEERCDAMDPRTLTVGTTLTPSISWDAPISDLYVYQDAVLQWHVWSDDLQNSLAPLTYGDPPTGTSEGFPAIPLEAGVEYELQADVACVNNACEAKWRSFYQPFTPQP